MKRLCLTENVCTHTCSVINCLGLAYLDLTNVKVLPKPQTEIISSRTRAIVSVGNKGTYFVFVQASLALIK